MNTRLRAIPKDDITVTFNPGLPPILHPERRQIGGNPGFNSLKDYLDHYSDFIEALRGVH
jgi:hypothetical protein